MSARAWMSRIERLARRLPRSWGDALLRWDARRTLRRAGVDPALVRLRGRVVLNFDRSARVAMAPGSVLANCRVQVRAGACLTLAGGAGIVGCRVGLAQGATLELGRESRLQGVRPHAVRVDVADGRVRLGPESRVRASLWVRYGGVLEIGARTYINQGSEVRCDERVTIGDETLVSYEVSIFDNNTHATDWRERLGATRGTESRPDRRAVQIGDHVWVGKRAAILKGVRVGDRSIIGLGAVVAREVPPDSLALGNPAQVRPQRRKEAA